MRHNPRVIGAVAATLVLPVLGIAATSGSAGASTSPKAEYAAALRASGTESVHYVSKAEEQGVSIQVIGDTGVSSGSQELTLKKGSLTENISVILIGTTGYLKGNAPALINILGIKTAQAAKYSERWISFSTATSTMAELVAGLHNKDVANELTMSGPYSSGGTKTIAGQSTKAIKGFVSTSSGTKVPVVLYISSSSSSRPVEEITNPGKGGSAIRGSVTFSKWGEKKHLSTPTDTVPFTTVSPATTATPPG